MAEAIAHALLQALAHAQAQAQAQAQVRARASGQDDDAEPAAPPRTPSPPPPPRPTAEHEYVDEDDGKPIVFPDESISAYRMKSLIKGAKGNAPLQAAIKTLDEHMASADRHIVHGFRSYEDCTRLPGQPSGMIRRLCDGLATRLARVYTLVAVYQARTGTRDMPGTPLSVLLNQLCHRLQIFTSALQQMAAQDLHARTMMAPQFRHTLLAFTNDARRMLSLIKAQLGGNRQMRGVTAFSHLPAPAPITKLSYLHMILVAHIRSLANEVNADVNKFATTLPENSVAFVLLLRVFLSKLQPASIDAQQGHGAASAEGSEGPSEEDLFRPFPSAAKSLEQAQQWLFGIGFENAQQLSNFKISASNRLVYISNAAHVPGQSEHIFAPCRVETVLLILTITFAQLHRLEPATLACEIYVASLRHRLATDPTSQSIKMHLILALAALALLFINTPSQPLSIQSQNPLALQLFGPEYRTFEALRASEEAVTLFRGLRQPDIPADVNARNVLLSMLNFVYAKSLYEQALTYYEQPAFKVFLLRKSRSTLASVLLTLKTVGFNVKLDATNEQAMYLYTCALEQEASIKKELEEAMESLKTDHPVYLRKLEEEQKTKSKAAAMGEDKPSKEGDGGAAESNPEQADAKDDWDSDENLQRYTRKVLAAEVSARLGGGPKDTPGAPSTPTTLPTGQPQVDKPAPPPVLSFNITPLAVLARLRNFNYRVYGPLYAAELLKEADAESGQNAQGKLVHGAAEYERLSAAWPTQYQDKLAQIYFRMAEYLLKPRLRVHDIINAVTRAANARMRVPDAQNALWRGYNSIAALFATRSLFLAHIERYDDGFQTASQSLAIMNRQKVPTQKVYTAEPIALKGLHMWLSGSFPIDEAIEEISTALSTRQEYSEECREQGHFYNFQLDPNGLLPIAWIAGAQCRQGRIQTALSNGRDAVEMTRNHVRKPQPITGWIGPQKAEEQALMPSSCILPHVLVIWSGILLAAGAEHHDEALAAVEEALFIIWEQTMIPAAATTAGGVMTAEVAPEGPARTDGSTAKTGLLIKAALLEERLKKVEVEDKRKGEAKREEKRKKRAAKEAKREERRMKQAEKAGEMIGEAAAEDATEDATRPAAEGSAEDTVEIKEEDAEWASEENSEEDETDEDADGATVASESSPKVEEGGSCRPASRRRAQRKGGKSGRHGGQDDVEMSDVSDWEYEFDEGEVEGYGQRNGKRVPKVHPPSQRQMSLRFQLEACRRMAERMPERGFLHRLLPDEKDREKEDPEVIRQILSRARTTA
ncbi:hypothetical protein OC834_006811 [Tilletia horrida]|nr:hypothetical protein OC834_006811 [Tilletia horrida]